jgi:phosphate starvation-inducible protein PhoH and related proteins
LSNKGKARRKAAQVEAVLANKKTEERKEYNVQVHKKKVLASILSKEIKVTPKTENQKLFMDIINDLSAEMVIGSGLAGTGKSFLAISQALNMLRNPNNTFTELILFKSVTQLKGEETGFLPGDLKEKMAYINLSFFMQFGKLIEEKDMVKLFDEGFIKVYPLGSIRGASISDKSIVIVDEVQNLSVDNLHAVVTRMEEKSKLILIGDISQRDAPNTNQNALRFMSEHYRNIDEKIQIVDFTYEDVVRSELIKKLQWVYENNAPRFHKSPIVQQKQLLVEDNRPKLEPDTLITSDKPKKKWFIV